MSEKWLFGRNATFGTTEYFHTSEDGNSFTIETVQDVEPILDRNKADLNMVSGTDRWGDGKLVASVPAVIWTDWMRKGWTSDEKKLKSLLDDPDNKFMRRWPGRLS